MKSPRLFVSHRFFSDPIEHLGRWGNGSENGSKSVVPLRDVLDHALISQLAGIRTSSGFGDFLETVMLPFKLVFYIVFFGVSA